MVEYIPCGQTLVVSYAINLMTTLLASHRLSQNSPINQTLLNRGLHYGDGLFETILLHHGKLVLQDLHLERLSRDSRRLFISLNIDTVEQELNQFVSALQLPVEQSAVIKIIVSRGWGGRGYGFTVAEDILPEVCFLAYSYTATPISEINAIFCQQNISVNPTLAGIKHLSRLEQVMLSHELVSKKADEGIVCDCYGAVVEGVSSNVFAVIDGVCCTPILDKAGVAGVMRHYLLQTVLPCLNIPAVEKNINVAQLDLAQELFFTNSIKGVLPVSALAEKKYTNHSVANKIQQYLQKEHNHAFG